jgi:hypothetical protein
LVREFTGGRARAGDDRFYDNLTLMPLSLQLVLGGNDLMT